MSVLNPLVSIVVPVYNVEKYHRRCLDSLVNQTYSNIEIILVNDGSTDGTVAIMEEFAAKDKRIKILHKENGGQASARNLGLTVVTGEWVWNVDSDDYVELDSVEKMVATALENDSDIVVCGHYLKHEFDDDKKAVSARFEGTITGERALIMMLNHKIGGDPWCKLIKTELYTKSGFTIDERYSVIDDVILNYRMYSLAKRVSECGIIGPTHIFMRADSTSSHHKTRRFLRLHHLGAVSMKDYGFISPAVEKAYNGFVFLDFLNIYTQKDKELLKELNLYSIKGLNNMLKLLKNSDLSLSRAQRGGVLNLLRALSKTAITRFAAACLLKLRAGGYAENNRQDSGKN